MRCWGAPGGRALGSAGIWWGPRGTSFQCSNCSTAFAEILALLKTRCLCVSTSRRRNFAAPPANSAPGCATPAPPAASLPGLRRDSSERQTLLANSLRACREARLPSGLRVLPQTQPRQEVAVGGCWIASLPLGGGKLLCPHPALRGSLTGDVAAPLSWHCVGAVTLLPLSCFAACAAVSVLALGPQPRQWAGTGCPLRGGAQEQVSSC